ncbi:hypothetical protein [Kocuria rhizophila]|uniref:hypothetical protein n=1 Tax=Kocuria rhizophila TaxID=72000 RepID=UPI00190A8017|nr:hypothetical protein [Kocuria rhizophila]MBK4119691.1 hypothetical protein [Kocuria rhizophila]
MNTEILLSRPTAVIPVEDIKLAGSIQAAVQTCLKDGAEQVALTYETRQGLKTVEIDSRTQWEVTTTDATSITDPDTVLECVRDLRETGHLDVSHD